MTPRHTLLVLLLFPWLVGHLYLNDLLWLQQGSYLVIGLLLKKERALQLIWLGGGMLVNLAVGYFMEFLGLYKGLPHSLESRLAQALLILLASAALVIGLRKYRLAK